MELYTCINCKRVYPNTKEIIALGCKCLTQGFFSAPNPSLRVTLTPASEKMPLFSQLTCTLAPKSLFTFLAFIAFCFFIILYLQRCSISFWDCGIKEQNIRRKVTDNQTNRHNEFLAWLCHCCFPCFPHWPCHKQCCTSWHPPPNILLLKELFLILLNDFVVFLHVHVP